MLLYKILVSSFHLLLRKIFHFILVGYVIFFNKHLKQLRKDLVENRVQINSKGCTFVCYGDILQPRQCAFLSTWFLKEDVQRRMWYITLVLFFFCCSFFQMPSLFFFLQFFSNAKLVQMASNTSLVWSKVNNIVFRSRYNWVQFCLQQR